MSIENPRETTLKKVRGGTRFGYDNRQLQRESTSSKLSVNRKNSRRNSKTRKAEILCHPVVDELVQHDVDIWLPQDTPVLI